MIGSKCVFLGVCATLVVMINGNAFRKAMPKHDAETVSQQDVQTSLLAEIEASLGTGIAARRIPEIQAILDPMFSSLPKNQYGNLEHVTVRYALHRVFVQRHGWSIKGLDPAGDSWNSSSPTEVLKDQVSSYIQELFEKRLGGRGLGVKELSVFAATIEHMVHNEAIGRLGSALQIHDILPTSSMTSAEADQVLDTYMMAYILGESMGKLTKAVVNRLVDRMSEIYLAWPETQAFVRQTRENLTNNEKWEIDFASLVRVAETVGEKFGKFQDAECQGLKSALMKIEDRGSGRVRLSDFYKPAAANQDGAWQFQESIGYLRELGALDESNPDDPRVMIPNYLISQTNCIASSDYYSVCCINECEDLLVRLETDIAAPEAKPAQIIELISALPSSSVSVPRTVSATLVKRLEDIAVGHSGLIQLHSRLFSQWMHHAYPRECPFPHVAGTTSQAKPGEWTENSGVEAQASEEELLQFTSETNSSSISLEEVEDMHDLMMWTHEEELLVVRSPSAAMHGFGSASYVAGARNVIMFAVMAALAFGLVRSSLGSSGNKQQLPKFMV
jgi:hypothetical protein